MISLTFLTALLLTQQPGHPITSRHHKTETPVNKRLDDLTLDVIGFGEYVESLEKRVKELERHQCRCQDHVQHDKPKPTFTPVYEWRGVVGYPGLHYYGYEQDGVFHVQYQSYDGPAPIRWQAGCVGGACR